MFRHSSLLCGFFVFIVREEVLQTIPAKVSRTDLQGFSIYEYTTFKKKLLNFKLSQNGIP